MSTAALSSYRALSFNRFDRDFSWRTGVRLIPISTASSTGFTISIAAVESAYRSVIASEIRVRGILLTNPSNPLGTVLDEPTLRSLLAFATSHRLHLVVDEIFAGTNFTSDPPFKSVSEILQSVDPVNIINPNLVHIVYSLSKVLGLPGFRAGLVYSYNDEVVSCARKMSSFGLVSTQTQHFLASLLSDDNFTTKFLEESSRRLGERYRVFTSGLARMGIGCLESNAGLFCWMNLRRLLKEETVEGEMELWRVIVDEVKLNVSPGSSFHCSDPGWFRVCYANMDAETMEVALTRIKSFVCKEKKRREWKKGSLRLSLPRRFEDITVMTPRLMSPHSPLVHAAN